MAETQESKVISSLLRSDASPSSAVQDLLAITTSPKTQGSDALWHHLNNTWGSLMELVSQRSPAQQTPLVEFVRSLQQQNVTDPTTGEQLRFDQDYNKVVWSEVPNLGIVIADEWNFSASDPSPDVEEARIYDNKTAFLAQLTASPANSSTSDPPFDFSLYALWAFREAFEFPKAPTPACIRAACYWLIYAADRLWSNVTEKRDFRHKSSGSNPAEEGDKYAKKGWVGFNRERWNIWTASLEDAKKTDDEKLHRLIESALKQVEKAMDQSWRLKDEEKFA